MKILFHHQKFYQTDLIKRIENEDFVRSSKIILDSISDQTRTLNHVQLKKELYFFQMRPRFYIFALEKTE